VVPRFKTLFPLGEPAEPQPWLGKRPCFADSLPVIGRAPGQPGLWLDYGHGHYGLTLGPITGRLLAEMITGATPFTDPAPFGPQRFN
jgi:D-amino-acid dehydrogenase